MDERVVTAAPALSLLQRRQLLWLAQQAAGAALLRTPSLVIGHRPHAIKAANTPTDSVHSQRPDVRLVSPTREYQRRGASTTSASGFNKEQKVLGNAGEGTRTPKG
jgi:hypothetical protein